MYHYSKWTGEKTKKIGVKHINQNNKEKILIAIQKYPILATVENLSLLMKISKKEIKQIISVGY